ncbi:MAG: hypothetical protein Q8K32_30045 [Archangium sp.]|nr:hypothetical protein [Archangium sp.]
MSFRALTFTLFSSFLVSCACEGPVVDTCDPARCAGCCIDGRCTSCGTGGGNTTGGGGGSTTTGGGGGTTTTGGGGGTTTTGGGGGSTPTGGGGGNTSTGGGGGSTATGGGGGSTPTGGGGGNTATGGGSGVIDFDGGWRLPVYGRNPALIGDGGTTVVGTGATNFTGPTTGSAISVVYPPTGVMLPPNTNSMEFHFIPGAGQTLFRFTFQAPTTTLVVYTACTPVGAGCIYTPDPSFWSNLAAFARGTAPVTWTVAGVNGSSPGNAIGSSTVQSMSFSEQDLRGGLYYWNTGGSLERFDYGFPNSPRQTYLSPANVGAVCVGCHVISRQGNQIAVGKNAPLPVASYDVRSVPTKAVLSSMAGPLSGSANFFSFSPDEAHLLTSSGQSINWLRLLAGNSTQVTNNGSMPDWSPDGRHMVFARAGFTIPFGGSIGVSSASLQTMRFNGTGFDAPVQLVAAAGQNNYYPTYSPDNQWVLFNRSPSNKESSSNATVDQNDGGLPDGELWTVPATGGTPLRLSQATNPGATSWPKWAPVKHHYAGGEVMWLTFSSGRPYGLRLGLNEKVQLWMVAFDPARAASAQDPSFPAFWLPFQDLGSGNHIGQWSTEVPRAPCTGTGPSTCSQGEVCVNSRCRPG